LRVIAEPGILRSGFNTADDARHGRKPPESPRVLKSALEKMDLTTEDRRPSQDAARLTPREGLERFVSLQRRARQLLAASPEGFRQYWARNLRQRSIHVRF